MKHNKLKHTLKKSQSTPILIPFKSFTSNSYNVGEGCTRPIKHNIKNRHQNLNKKM